MVILFGDLPKEIFKQSLDAGIVQIERFPVDQKYNEYHAQKMDEEYWQVPRQLCYTGRQNDTTEEREYDIMMNPASLMKIMNARNKFVENHPKFAAFLNAVFSAGITEGTVIEITVTKPGEEPITTNMKVLQSDLDLLDELKNLAQ